MINIYVDGSHNIVTDECGYGYVVVHKNGEIVRSFSGTCLRGSYNRQRNVYGEIMSVIESLEWCLTNLKDEKSMVIHYDYLGVQNWPDGLWKANNKLTKTYKEYVNIARSLSSIRFVKVKSHSGNKYNEMADTLAKRGAGIAV